MKLEDQVCSLDLAKRLKELGVKQDGFFEWTHHIVGQVMLWEVFLSDPHDTVNEKCSAFTLSELGELLGFHIGGRNKLDRNPTEPFWCMEKKGATEADARAKMLIYLLENKLVKLESQ